MKDRDTLFHERWLGLAQPIEGLVFSVPVLADAQIAPEVPADLSTRFAAFLEEGAPPRIRSLERFFREFLGYDTPGMLVRRDALPADLSFYAAEGGQEIRPTFALGRGPFEEEDLFASPSSAAAAPLPSTEVSPSSRFSALLWDLTEYGHLLDLDAPETATGPWRYPPTAKLERLLRHAGVPVGLLFNGAELRLVYAPAGESTAHLTFRVEHLARPDGRPLLAALELLLHARRAYSAAAEHTLEGLLAESRRRQADVTEALAKQVFEAVEILVAGLEAAASRDSGDGRIDWLRAALEEPRDHFYQGVLGVVLRLVFLLYAEDTSLLPIEHPTYAEHLSLFGLHARLAHDAGVHPESMHHRFGAWGQLLSLFRSVFFGVKHGSLELPPRHGRLFDPNAYPFLEGGLPGWTAAVVDPVARAEAHPPSVDDGTVYDVLHRLVVFGGQRLSYRALDVEQIGSIYESLMGYHVRRVESPAVRLGKHGVWVESERVAAMTSAERARFFKEDCGLNPGPVKAIDEAIRGAGKDMGAVAQALGEALRVAVAGRPGLGPALLAEGLSDGNVMAALRAFPEAAPSALRGSGEPVNPEEVVPLLTQFLGRPWQEKVFGVDIARALRGSTRVELADLADDDKVLAGDGIAKLDRTSVQRMLDQVPMDREAKLALAVMYFVHELVHVEQGIGDKALVSALRSTGGEMTLMHIDLGADHAAALAAAVAFPKWRLDWLKDLQGRSLAAFPVSGPAAPSSIRSRSPWSFTPRSTMEFSDGCSARCAAGSPTRLAKGAYVSSTRAAPPVLEQ